MNGRLSRYKLILMQYYVSELEIQNRCVYIWMYLCSLLKLSVYFQSYSNRMSNGLYLCMTGKISKTSKLHHNFQGSWQLQFVSSFADLKDRYYYSRVNDCLLLKYLLIIIDFNSNRYNTCVWRFYWILDIFLSIDLLIYFTNFGIKMR